ncbi:MAG: BppU family phage baseplate upper protein [Clostridia bacterium]|nr:BppU family phage baseplate upper protein [Clostridia bacterium]
MEKVTRNITVDLSRKSNARVVFATQNDLKSRRLSIRLTDDGKPYSVSRDVTATVNFACADGTSGAYLGEVCENGYVEYVIDAAILLCAGQTKCSVSLTGADGAKLTSSQFVIDVASALYAGDDISPEAAQSLIDSMMQAHATMQEAEARREAQDTVREGNEASREAAEIGRADAENQRAEAEQSRQGYYESIDELLLGIEEVQKGYIGEFSDSAALVELGRVYPIGSVYISEKATSPAQLFGGVWEQIHNRFLAAAGGLEWSAAGTMGGTAAHAHEHDLWADIYILGEDTEHRDKGIMLMRSKSHENFRYMDYILQDNGALTRVTLPNKDVTGSIAYKHATDVDGTINSSSNLPPYLTVYMWKRVA